MLVERFSPPIQLVIYGLAVLALSLIFGQLCIVPLRSQLESVKQEIGRLEKESATASDLQLRLNNVETEVSKQRQLLGELEQVLPGQAETAEIIRQIHALAVESQLHIRSFAPGNTTSREVYEEWPILISLEGNYDNLGRFFEKVSRLPRVISIRDLSIEALESGVTRLRTLKATCTASTLVILKSDETVAGTENQDAT
jgi:type IV pilus assembly protein PilO